MMRLQRWDSGPYFTAFSLHIPDMRSFLHVREIVKICPRSAIVAIKSDFYQTGVSLSHTQVRQAARRSRKEDYALPTGK